MQTQSSNLQRRVLPPPEAARVLCFTAITAVGLKATMNIERGDGNMLEHH